MFKPLNINVEDVRAKSAQREAAASTATSVFKVLHGFYGNLFLAKFQNGQIDKETGFDLGVDSAKSIWGHGLRKYSESVVRAALSKCLADHPKFPPSLPEFVALCEASQPRKTHAELNGFAMLPSPTMVRLEAQIELVGDGKDQFRKIWARHLAGDKTLTQFSVRSAMEVLDIKKEARRANP